MPRLAVARSTGLMMRRKISLTDDFQQAGERYRSLSKKDQDFFSRYYCRSALACENEYPEKDGGELKFADADPGKRVEKGLKLRTEGSRNDSFPFND